MKFAMSIIFACATFAGTSAALAASIVVGQVAPLSGPESSQGRAYAAGMQLLFSSVNRNGGVNGHTFTLVSKDDGGRAEDTLGLTRKLLAENEPMVLAGYFGSRNIAALLGAGVLDKGRIALVGYRAAEVRAETPLLYNVRASLVDEVNKMINHLATIGVTRLGVLYEEGPAAAGLLAAIDEAARNAQAAVVSKASYEAGSTRVADAIDAFIKDRPQAILVLSSGDAAARFIERYRSEGGAAQVFVHSGADMERVTQRIAENRLAFVSSVMQGVAIAQVVPGPQQVSRLARELAESAAKGPRQELPLSYVTMEGFIAAKVIVEAVRRQGLHPTREGMAAALDGIDNLNLGGYVVGFKPGLRDGSKFVELTIISATGRIRQ